MAGVPPYPTYLLPACRSPAAVYGVPMSAGRCRALVRQPFKFKNKLIPLLFKVLPEWRR